MIWLMLNIKIWLKEHNHIKLSETKAFKIARNQNYDGYQKGLALMVYKFFDKKSVSGSDIATLANKSAIKSMPN